MPRKKIDKKVWDEIAPVEPTRSTEKPTVADTPEEGVPFGSRSEVQKVIADYRTHFKKTAPDKNGVATAPNGTSYNYYLSSDVFDHADEFVTGKGYFLEFNQYVTEAGQNIMQLVLEHIVSGEKKVVEANLGNPNTMGDFGARITYAPKYLIAIMFGVSVQTDTDAFNNGQVKTVGQAMPVTVNQTKNELVSKPPATAPVAQTEAPKQANTPQYQTAKSFIENTTMPEMLDQAETKVNNSVHMTDGEKVELLQLIASKRQ